MSNINATNVDDDLIDVQGGNVEIYDQFDDMNLSHKLVRGIYGYGFEAPSAIQQRAIIPIISGQDVIAQAQSGTGKTATFVIGILGRINVNINTTQALVLSPTRELAHQSQKVLNTLGCFIDQLKTHLSIGGTRVGAEKQKLENNIPHVIVGTPGRVNQMINSGHIRTDECLMIVLDEADQLLSMGFSDQINNILRTFPSDVQVVMVSATMPDEALKLSETFMRNPIKILVKQEQTTLEGIKQFYIDLQEESWKYETLMELYDTIKISMAVIFVNTVKTAVNLSQALNQDSFIVSTLHSEMEQHERETVMSAFRSGASRILVTTDIMARGIDVQQVSLVINYDIPQNRETYVHRIGRGGRFGRKGVAINFMGPNDKRMIENIQAHYDTVINELPENIADLV